MARGPKAGSGKSPQRILAVLRGLGSEKDGRPRAIRAAELAEKSGISHNNLSKAVRPLVDGGQVTSCLVSIPRGRPTYEYRIGPGVAAPDFRPLDVRRVGIATAPIGKPLPKLAPAATPTDDAAMLQRVQRMTEEEFAGLIAHLARVWSWGRGKVAA